MSKRNERTSARVAKIAGRIVALEVNHLIIITAKNVKPPTWPEIQAVAASCLTQAADKTEIRFHHMGNEPGEPPGPRRKNGRIRIAKKQGRK